MEVGELALDICIFLFFLISAYFGVKDFKEIDNSLKEIDMGIAAVSFLVGFILLLKQFG